MWRQGPSGHARAGRHAQKRSVPHQHARIRATCHSRGTTSFECRGAREGRRRAGARSRCQRPRALRHDRASAQRASVSSCSEKEPLLLPLLPMVLAAALRARAGRDSMPPGPRAEASLLLARRCPPRVQPRPLAGASVWRLRFARRRWSSLARHRCSCPKPAREIVRRVAVARRHHDHRTLCASSLHRLADRAYATVGACDRLWDEQHQQTLVEWAPERPRWWVQAQAAVLLWAVTLRAASAVARRPAEAAAALAERLRWVEAAAIMAAERCSLQASEASRAFCAASLPAARRWRACTAACSEEAHIHSASSRAAEMVGGPARLPARSSRHWNLCSVLGSGAASRPAPFRR